MTPGAGIETAARYGVHILLAVTMLSGFLLTSDDIGRLLVPLATTFVLAVPIALVTIVRLERRWVLVRYLDISALFPFLGTVALVFIASVRVTALGWSWLLGCSALALVGALLAHRAHTADLLELGSLPPRP